EEFARDPLERGINTLHTNAIDTRRKFLLVGNIQCRILQLQQQPITFGQSRALVKASSVLCQDQSRRTGKDQFVFRAVIVDKFFSRLRTSMPKLRRFAMTVATLNEAMRAGIGIHIGQIDEKFNKRRTIVVVMINMRSIGAFKNRVEPERNAG